jgi:hypothetical protein
MEENKMVDRRMMLRFFGTGVVLVAFSPLPGAAAGCTGYVETPIVIGTVGTPPYSSDTTSHTFLSGVDSHTPCCTCNTDKTQEQSQTDQYASGITTTATQTKEVDGGLATLFKLLTGIGVKATWVSTNTSTTTSTAAIVPETLRCGEHFEAWIDTEVRSEIEVQPAGMGNPPANVTRTKTTTWNSARDWGVCGRYDSYDPCTGVVVPGGLPPGVTSCLQYGGW